MPGFGAGPGRLPGRHATILKCAAILGIAVLGFVALHHLLADVRLHDVRMALHAVSPGAIALAIVLTAISYFVLTLYDVLALRIIGRPLPYRTAAIASLTSYTFSHNFGFALITGGSARYRIYSAAGLEIADIVRVIATASITFWAGVHVLTAVALLVHRAPLALGFVTLPVPAQRLAGAVILALAGLAAIALRRGGRSIDVFGWKFPWPTLRQAGAQLAIAVLDLTAASAALLVLVPGVGPPALPSFFLGYTLAIVAALFSHVPGGIGIFEAVMLATLPRIAPSALLAALILYRLIYYLLPLAIGATLFAIHEQRGLGRPLAMAFDVLRLALRGVAPTFLSALVFTGGVVLLVSGSLPAIPDRLHLLRHVAPLPFVEASHIAASLAGTALLLLAPGLYRRLDAAFLLCRALLLAGAVFSLAKGLDYEEALILTGIAALLQLSRPAFYRRTALTTALGTPRALVAAAVAVMLSVWIGFFAYKHVDYQNDLWWQFAWKGDASRYLRASFAIAVVLVGVALQRLLGHAAPHADPSAANADTLMPALAASEHTDAMLALTGDKRFLRSPDGRALLMYQVQGQSWIVMGNPVGPREYWPDLLWRIREMADTAQGRLLLYQLSLDAVPVAIDLGLHLVKYGEEARVALEEFTLDRPEMRSLRHAERRAMREGATFGIVAARDVPSIMDELRSVSHAWLKDKGHAEKLFSVGRFDPAYLARFDCAAVHRQGRLIAFANIWATANGEELSVDLMRHVGNMPYGTMDFLFVQLMRWGQAQGYRWFSLGIAPLSGIEVRRLAPMWARIGALLYRHGDAFYGFEGLRAYKDKFMPIWEPRYIAAPHGVGLARGLIDLQTLVSGGGKSVAARHRMALVA